MRFLIFSGFGLLIVMNFLIKEKYYFKFSDEKKTILLWTDFFDDKNWELGNNTLDEKFLEELGCAETRCVITSNKTLMKVEEFDALVFHVAQSWEEIPEKRNPHQIYVAACLESPVYASKDLETKDDLFNWTSKHLMNQNLQEFVILTLSLTLLSEITLNFFWKSSTSGFICHIIFILVTYRLGSDVQWFYGGFIDIESGTAVKPVDGSLPTIWKPYQYSRDENFMQTIKNKTKDMAWLVSHCNTLSDRESLVKGLQKYLTVDVYGDCGDLRYVGLSLLSQ